MAFGVLLLALLVLFMLAGALPAKGGGQTAVFRTPVFACLLVCLCGSLLLCSWGRFRLRHTAFLLTHLGVILILAGAFAGFAFGRKTQFGAPIAESHAIRELPGPENTTFELPFSLAVNRFDVTFYPPVYHLYHPPASGTKDDDEATDLQYVYERDLHTGTGAELQIDKQTAIPEDALKDSQGNWTRQYVLPDGRLLQLAEPTPKYYEAVLTLDAGDDGVTTRKLAVNHPVSFHGWRFYLMSYDREARRYVVLSARRDPGRRAVIAGIWAVIAGIAWMCWRAPSAEFLRNAVSTPQPRNTE
jgi:hypothetical protein